MQIEFRIELRRRIAALAIAVEQIMLERIDPRLGDIGVAREIEFGIELRQRADAATGAVAQEMREQCFARFRAMPRGVPGEVEDRRRRAPLGLADGNVVAQRIGAGAGDILVLLQVPARVEISVRLPAVTPAVGDEMLECIDAAGTEIGRLVAVEGGVEQAGFTDDAEVVGVDHPERLADRARLAVGPDSADNAIHGMMIPRNPNGGVFAATRPHAYLIQDNREQEFTDSAT